jgi:hypothetical protein
MSLNRKVSMIFIVIILISTVIFALYYFFVIEKSFIKKLYYETSQLNDLIILYEQKGKELNALKEEYQSDTFRKKLSQYFVSKNTIKGRFEKSEFMVLFKGLLNSKTTLIEQMDINVNTNFPFVFDSIEKINIDFFIKVGDLLE